MNEDEARVYFKNEARGGLWRRFAGANARCVWRVSSVLLLAMIRDIGLRYVPSSGVEELKLVNQARV